MTKLQVHLLAPEMVLKVTRKLVQRLLVIIVTLRYCTLYVTVHYFTYL